MTGGPELPAATQRYLSERAPEGERNDALFAASCQFRDAGAGLPEAESQLIPCGVRDGLPEAEARKTVRSAYRGQQREPIRHRFQDRTHAENAPRTPLAAQSRNGTGDKAPAALKRFRLVQGPAEALPGPVDDGARKLIESAYEPGELVSIGAGTMAADGHDHPASGGETMTRDEWLEALESLDDTQLWPRNVGAGVFIRVNPMQPDGKTDADVTAYRHALLEWDDQSLERQWKIIRDSRIPVTAVISSGGRSLHAWVRVDARSAEEYRERVAALHEFFADCPPCAKNKNPSRFSRLPGVARGTAQQTLLATKIGAASYGEWLEEAREQADGIQVFRFNQLATYDYANDPNTLIGQRWVCRGGSVMWVGQSGIGKSSLAAQAAMCWAIGIPFFGVTPVRPLRSLVIQAENDIGDLAEAMQGVRRAIGFDHAGLPPEEIDRLLEENLIFVRNSTRTGNAAVALAEGLITKHRPDILWLDPLLAYVGDDLRQQKVASQFLREALGSLQLKTGVVVMLVHHTPKPTRNKDGGRPDMTDEDFLYAGLGSVEFVNWPRATVVLRQQGEGEDGRPCYVLRFQKRGERAGALGPDGSQGRSVFLQHGQECISWRQIPEPQKPTARSRNAGQFESHFKPDDLLQFLDPKTPVKTGKWQSAAATEIGMAKTTFHRLRVALLKDGKIEKKDDGYVVSTS